MIVEFDIYALKALEQLQKRDRDLVLAKLDAFARGQGDVRSVSGRKNVVRLRAGRFRIIIELRAFDVGRVTRIALRNERTYK